MVFNEKIYCALVILMELMAAYGKRGCLLEDIARKHEIPIADMQQVTSTLECACMVVKCGKIKQWLLLASSPVEIRIFKVIELFTNRFTGLFTDPHTGDIVARNQTLTFLDEQRRVVEDAVRNRWSSITLERLYHMKDNRFFY